MFEDKLNEMEWELDTHGITKPLSDFEKMLAYHEIDDRYWKKLSGNERRNMLWNYRKFGRNKK